MDGHLTKVGCILLYMALDVFMEKIHTLDAKCCFVIASLSLIMRSIFYSDEAFFMMWQLKNTIILDHFLI